MSDKQNTTSSRPAAPRRGGMGPGGRGGFGAPVEKPKDFKGTLRRLAQYLKPRSTQLIVVFFMAIFSTVFTIIGPKILGKAITRLFQGIMMKLQGIPGAAVDFDYILQILMILAGIYVLSSLFNFVMQYMMAGVAQNTAYDLRNRIKAKLTRLPLEYYDKNAHGDILSRVTNDLDTVAATLQQSITQLITSVVTLIGVIIMMLSISPVLTLVTILVLPLSGITTALIAKRSQKQFKEQQRLLGKLNGHVEEMFTGHRIVKAFGYEEQSLDSFNEDNEKLQVAGWKAQFLSGVIMPLMQVINNIGYVIVCVVGGIFVTKRTIEIGDIQAFIQYSRQFGQPIVQVANIANVIQSTIAAAERVFQVLDEPEQVQDTEDAIIPENSEGNVNFNDVSFRYKPDVPLIDKMNISVSQGQSVAIVGPTGAGKTTLVNLLMRFYETDKGSINIDGNDLRSIQRGHLRNIFGMVLQDTWLFGGTIRENIAYGKDDATEEEITRASETAHADHFIRTLPHGYDTIVNEEGNNISEGQKQLITIARALLADPPVLILDEATSSVDTRTELLIQKAMHRLMAGRTNFIIAHRLSTIRDADLILVMNEGNVIEQGTHESLLEENGFYAELYNSQFTGSPLRPAG